MFPSCRGQFVEHSKPSVRMCQDSEQSVMKTGEPLTEELAAMQRFASRMLLRKRWGTRGIKMNLRLLLSDTSSSGLYKPCVNFRDNKQNNVNVTFEQWSHSRPGSDFLLCTSKSESVGQSN